jgi:hypothetical protein
MYRIQSRFELAKAIRLIENSRRPQKLADLAWTRAINSSLLDKQQFANFVPKI